MSTREKLIQAWVTMLALADELQNISPACRGGISRSHFYEMKDAFEKYGRHGLAVLEELVAHHGAPMALRMGNGPEFLALRLTDWAEQRGITLDFTQPGKPAQNAFIERFNQAYRAEVLDAHLFRSLHEVRVTTHQWLRKCNTERPHDSLGRVPPLMFPPRSTNLAEYQLQVPA